MENPLDENIERGLTRVFCWVGAFILACVAGAAYAVLRLIQDSKEVIDSL